MKKTIMVFAVALILATCHLLNASSLELEKDSMSGDFYKQALEFQDSDRAGLQKRLDKATDNLIRATVGELKKRGHGALASSIEQDWEKRYKGFVYSFKPGRDVGDHEAITWLLSIHDKIEFVLGQTICKALRIHDLWTIAVTVKVVFSCVDNVDPVEYMKHFVPLSGVAAYWITYGGCAGATMGSGIIFLCGLGGMCVEGLVVRFIAPPLSLGAWKAVCQ